MHLVSTSKSLYVMLYVCVYPRQRCAENDDQRRQYKLGRSRNLPIHQSSQIITRQIRKELCRCMRRKSRWLLNGHIRWWCNDWNGNTEIVTCRESVFACKYELYKGRRMRLAAPYNKMPNSSCSQDSGCLATSKPVMDGKYNPTISKYNALLKSCK